MQILMNEKFYTLDGMFEGMDYYAGANDQITKAVPPMCRYYKGAEKGYLPFKSSNMARES